jgi:hypothetical protein
MFESMIDMGLSCVSLGVCSLEQSVQCMDNCSTWQVLY